MTNAFLNALKVKSSAVQSQFDSLKQDNTPPKFNTSLQIDNSKWAPVQNTLPACKVERVLNKGRLDIFFDSIPSEETRDQLKQRCFKYDPDRKAWYNKDTLLNRLFLSSLLGIDFPEATESTLSLVNDAEQVTVAPTVPELSLVNPEQPENDSENYSRFKKQVNELMGALNCDAADLMLLAVDCLHRETFQ